MQKVIYSTKYFHAHLFNNDKMVVDNEIMNDISADWDYLKGRPSVVGLLQGDRIVIFFAEDEDDEYFPREVIYELKNAGTDLYAFNRHMEMGNFKGSWDFDTKIKEIKPFRAKGWNKDRFYNELISNRVIPDCNIVDRFQGDASLCIYYWDKFLMTGKREHIMKVVEHNLNCLLKESVILKYKSWFLENYKTDQRGFLVDG